MKRYVSRSYDTRDGQSSRVYKGDESILKQSCQEIRRARAISDEVKHLLEKTFEKNFVEAMKLVDQNRIRLVTFTPSGRAVWVVNGRRKEYQVVPKSLFCTCDDYYFRVMGQKKQLCYHLIAQHLAEALGSQGRSELADSDYATFTSRWKPAMGSVGT